MQGPPAQTGAFLASFHCKMPGVEKALRANFTFVFVRGMRESVIMTMFCFSGPVAQLGARFHGMEEVDGSNPSRSTKTKPDKT